MFINDTPALTVTDIATHARRLAERKGGLDLVVVDYLQLLRSSNKSGNRVQEVAQLSSGLKALARELDVPVLALSQLSRSIEQRANKHPILSDLRDSGSLEQDADIVMFIHREVESIAGPVKIIVAKHRKGPVGTVRLFFDPATSRWTGLEQHKLEGEE
jgi:replicative DNA helicase